VKDLAIELVNVTKRFGNVVAVDDISLKIEDGEFFSLFAEIIIAPPDYRILLRLPSGELRRVRSDCRATVGQIGNVEHQNISLGKAGRKRHRGWRPTVRGSAMSPRDHPHGGGEGRTPIGMPSPKSPWGKPTLGYKTRRNKTTDKWIVRRRGKKRR